MVSLKMIQEAGIKYGRKFAMGNGNTYEIPCIKRLLNEELGPPAEWFDVFPFGPKIDVLERIQAVPRESKKGASLDPPFSPRQAKELYNMGLDAVEFSHYIKLVKDEMARIIKPGGKAVCMGWNTNGLGGGARV